MKKLLLILTILLNAALAFGQDFKFPTERDYPQLEKSAQKIENFVPKNWKIVEKAVGDLNGDKVDDCALVVKGNETKFVNKNDDLVEPFDTNPRILIILFKVKDRYELIEYSNTFVFVPESPALSEPFQSVQIKNGVLQLDFEHWQSAGSWATWQASYKFKYINKEFALIGADKTYSMRNSGETETRSYNFLTNKMSITTGNYPEDAKSKPKWKTYKVGKLKTFRTFPKPFEWEIEKDFFI